eukprot:TRINITY_DN4186_c0_g2_i2.p1 TRINITY_DN4186_c0_g2~~TRINITY_DN4186_c0_g2_i2.p1  ORF type:complete len:136 (+),score=38.00 TRINITY_DN4186_c0_g2_i2:25-432(+)
MEHEHDLTTEVEGETSDNGVESPVLPSANIGRLMKSVLPTHAIVSKEARDKVIEIVTEFIAFLTSEAIDESREAKRRVVTPDDFLRTLIALGFEDYAELMSDYIKELVQELQPENEDVGESQGVNRHNGTESRRK